MSAARPQRPAQADFPHPFQHRHQGHVGDSDPAHQQRHAPQNQKQGVHVLLHLLPQVVRFGRGLHPHDGRVVGGYRNRPLGGDQGGRPHLGADLDGGGRLQLVEFAGRSLRHDQGVEQLRLPLHPLQDAQHRETDIPHEHHRLLIHPGHVQAPGRPRPEHRHPVLPL